MLNEQSIQCPYCGEAFDAFIDISAGAQSYVEDCYVCCRPIEFQLVEDEAGAMTVHVKRDDE